MALRGSDGACCSLADQGALPLVMNKNKQTLQASQCEAYLPRFQQPAKPPPQIYLSKGINFHTLEKVIILISSVLKST